MPATVPLLLQPFRIIVWYRAGDESPNGRSNGPSGVVIASLTTSRFTFVSVIVLLPPIWSDLLFHPDMAKWTELNGVQDTDRFIVYFVSLDPPIDSENYEIMSYKLHELVFFLIYVFNLKTLKPLGNA